MATEEPALVNWDVLLGCIEIKPMPMIVAGKLFGYPHQIIQYDRYGSVRDSYFTGPAVWATYAN